jgi:hypothetical protein
VLGLSGETTKTKGESLKGTHDGEEKKKNKHQRS